MDVGRRAIKIRRHPFEDVCESRDESAVIDFVNFDLSVSIFTEDRISACTKTKQSY